MKTQNSEPKISKKEIALQLNNRINYLAKLNFSGIEKVKAQTEYYVCNDNDNDVLLNIWVVNPKLVVSTFAALNGVEINLSQTPIKLGINNFLRGQKLSILSVGSSIDDNVTFTLNASLTGGYKNNTFPISISLEKGETGEITLIINLI